MATLARLSLRRGISMLNVEMLLHALVSRQLTWLCVLPRSNGSGAFALRFLKLVELKAQATLK